MHVQPACHPCMAVQVTCHYSRHNCQLNLSLESPSLIRFTHKSTRPHPSQMDPAMEALMGFSSFSKVSNPTQQSASEMSNSSINSATGSNGPYPGHNDYSSHSFDSRAGRGQRGHRGGPPNRSGRGGRGAHRGSFHPMEGSVDSFAHKRQRTDGHSNGQGHRGGHSGGHPSGLTRGGRGGRGGGGSGGNFQTEGFIKDSFFEDPWAKLIKASINP